MDDDSIESAVVRQVLEESWSEIKGWMSKVKSETRKSRNLGFRVYYAAIRGENEAIEDYIMDLLGNAATKKGLDKHQFWWTLVQRYLYKSPGIQFLIAKVAFQMKLQKMFRKPSEKTYSPKDLENCLDFKLELLKRYQSHAASQQHEDKIVYARIMEDCAFDKFGIEDEVLHEEAACLLTLDKYRDYVEFLSTINHNFSSGIDRFAWILLLSSLSALYWLLLDLDSSLADV